MPTAHRTRSLTSPRAALAFAALAAVSVPQQAHALGGLYMMVGLGFGKFGGDDLVMEESPAGNDLPLPTGSEGCCAKNGLAGQFRLGYSLFGFAGEFGFLGNAWDIGSNTGGGGFIGGGVRFYPLDILQLGGVDSSDIPIDFGAGFLLGYALVGKEYAYQGVGFVIDFQVDYKLASFLSAGVKLDIGIPTFSDFVYTDFKNNVGRCLDAGGEQVVGDASNNYGRFNKGENSPVTGQPCSGSGPSATLISPQVVFTFHFDILD